MSLNEKLDNSYNDDPLEEIGDVEPEHFTPVQFVPSDGGDLLPQSTLTCRVIEDGQHTGNRIGLAELICKAGAPGPPPHWHAMHDETFYVTRGTYRFHTRVDGKEFLIDAKPGDCVVVPQKALHTFSNPFDEEAAMFFTCTPASYIRYFKLLSKMLETGRPMSKQMKVEAMAKLATIPAKIA